MSDVLNILRKVKSLLASEAQWTREHYARSAVGESRRGLSDDAVCWCLQGAIDRAAWELTGMGYSSEAEFFVFEAILSHNPLHAGIIQFNDDPITKFSDVQKVLDRAIEDVQRRSVRHSEAQ